MPRNTFLFDLKSNTGDVKKTVTVTQTVIAGWTGRDPVAVERHIAELEALGVRRPDRVPTFYRVSSSRLTTEAEIEVLGANSSGEVEFVLLQTTGRLWVGVGSDHTDRGVETYDVGFAKQVCDKPIAPSFWAFEETAARWDKLILRSYVIENESRNLYQERPAATVLDPVALIAHFDPGGRLPEGTLMFCGTVAAIGGVRGGSAFEFELADHGLNRQIRHSYRINILR